MTVHWSFENNYKSIAAFFSQKDAVNPNILF